MEEHPGLPYRLLFTFYEFLRPLTESHNFFRCFIETLRVVALPIGTLLSYYVIYRNLTTIEDLEKALEEERKVRAAKRVQAEIDQKAAVERVRAAAQEELARKMESVAREQEEQAKRLQALQVRMRTFFALFSSVGSLSFSFSVSFVSLRACGEYVARER